MWGTLEWVYFSNDLSSLLPKMVDETFIMWTLLNDLNEASYLANRGTYKEIQKSFTGPGWYWFEGSRDSGNFSLQNPEDRINQLTDEIFECLDKKRQNYKIAIDTTVSRMEKEDSKCHL